jgi:hypothetical protein
MQIPTVPFVSSEFLVLEVGIALRELLGELCIHAQMLPIVRVADVEATRGVAVPFAVLVEAIARQASRCLHEQKYHG